MSGTAIVITAAAAAVASRALGARRDQQPAVRPHSSPTLGEVGLGLLVVLLGAAGGYLARRKK
jgi:hypothetical protein